MSIIIRIVLMVAVVIVLLFLLRRNGFESEYKMMEDDVRLQR